jgi:hypothetical protein
MMHDGSQAKGRRSTSDFVWAPQKPVFAQEKFRRTWAQETPRVSQAVATNHAENRDAIGGAQIPHRPSATYARFGRRATARGVEPA